MNKQQANERLDALEKEAEELREIINAPDEKIPWNPSLTGDFQVLGSGMVLESRPRKLYSEAGSQFEIREAAERAAVWYRFYHRLYKLAEELNSSGRVGGEYSLCYRNDNYWRGVEDDGSHVDCLFESQDVANKAAYILNRDRLNPPHRQIENSD